MNHGNHPTKSYLVVDENDRTVQELHCANRQMARKEARRLARRTHGDVKLIELRDGRESRLVDTFQGREGSI
jgi:hypothetical protein